MQLKKNQSIRAKLALATSALLVTNPITTLAETGAVADNDRFDISRLYYTEQERVTVEKIQASVSKALNESNKFKFSYVYDTMSGASPNGRIYNASGVGSNITYTTASGNANTVANNAGGAAATWKTTFKDARTAFNAEWEHALTTTLKAVAGAANSSENDYDSRTYSGRLLWDVDQRRTTLTIGASTNFDTVKAIGGNPKGGTTIACMADTSFAPNWLSCNPNTIYYKPASKVTSDYLVGITQVWNRNTLMQFNVALSQEKGYLTDPYKQVSIVDSQFGGEIAIINEQRPDTRKTRALFYKVVYLPTDNIATHSSYRLFWDDWGIVSHTFDERIRFNFNEKIYIQAHGRLHWQGAADFFRSSVGADVNSNNYFANAPQYISADSRLGELATVTAGLKMGYKINNSSNISSRVENMIQKYNQALLPTMKTWIVQIILNIKF